MAYIKVIKDGNPLYYKGINEETGEIEYTKTTKDAMDKSTGFYIESELSFIKFHFQKTNPELAEETISYVDES